jgi:hypothetical protein
MKISITKMMGLLGEICGEKQNEIAASIFRVEE